MPSFSGSAPGKVILFGEHAVVYGQPAIAVPILQVSAKAFARPLIKAPSGIIHIEAPQVGMDTDLANLPEDNPLAKAVRATFSELNIDKPPSFLIKISSTIPVAAGLGSGAAVSVAIIRAASAFVGHPLPDEKVSALAFEVEKLHHGTPSGIDNTVITFAKPVFFIKGKPIETFKLAKPFTLLIADTGVASSTRIAVGDVRTAWEKDKDRYNQIFSAVGEIVQLARKAIEKGENEKLGPLMDQNQVLLKQMGASSTELDQLVKVAKESGAWGAKLSGGGRGGNMIALIEDSHAEKVTAGLLAAGAKAVIKTIVQ